MTSDLAAAGIPVVLCNSDPAGKLAGNICIEYEQGIHKAIQHVVDLCFISTGRPVRPVENGFIESFNGRLRDECLNVE